MQVNTVCQDSPEEGWLGQEGQQKSQIWGQHKRDGQPGPRGVDVQASYKYCEYCLYSGGVGEGFLDRDGDMGFLRRAYTKVIRKGRDGNAQRG